jgi:glycine oxidase
VFSTNHEISDVLVIGGGVIGMSIARELKKNGAGKIMLIERGRLGEEASFAAAGMLTPQADAEKRDDFFDLCFEGRGLYENFAAELKQEAGIDIELETSGTLSVSFNEKDSERLEKIYRWQSAAGFPVEKLNTGEVLNLEPSVSAKVRGGLLFPRDAQLENRLLVKALALSIKRAGVKVVENTAVETLLTEGNKVIGVETADRKFFAAVVVLATGAWSSFIKTGITNGSLLNVTPVRGQILSFQPSQKIFRRVIISSSGYLVPRADHRVLAGATVENVGFDKNVTTKGVQLLLKSAYEIAPALEKYQISDKWAGLRPRSVDDLPILGPCEGLEGLYVATGHYRNGILLAPITARIMSDSILDDKTSYFLRSFGAKRLVNAFAI